MRFGAQAGQANSDKVVFQHVTAEREALGNFVVDLTAELGRGAVRPVRPENWHKVYPAKAGIALGLNPACRKTGSTTDGQEVDRRLFPALQDLVSARHPSQSDWLVRADVADHAD